MSRRKKRLFAIALSAATVVASGQYMERSQDKSAGLALDYPSGAFARANVSAAQSFPRIVPTAAHAAADRPHALPSLPADPATGAGLPDGPHWIRLNEGSDPGAGALLPEAEEFGDAGRSCTPRLAADAVPGGTVRLSLSAPCHPESRVTVRHDFLRFDMRTDSLGRMEIEMPALAKTASFAAGFQDGAEVIRVATVPDARPADHVALLTTADTGAHLQVWSESPVGEAGALTVLGDPGIDGGRLVDVYSGLTGLDTMQISVETEVTAENCGRTITADIVAPDADGRIDARALVAVVPGCDELGGFLVLKNPSSGRTLLTN